MGPRKVGTYLLKVTDNGRRMYGCEWEEVLNCRESDPIWRTRAEALVSHVASIMQQVIRARAGGSVPTQGKPDENSKLSSEVIS